MASAYDDLKKRYDTAREGLYSINSNTYGIFNERQPVRDEITRKAAAARVGVSSAQSRMASSRSAATARNAFAAGKASAKSRLFRRNAGFGNLGKTEKANADRLEQAAKDAAELDLLDKQVNKPMQGLSWSFGTPISW